MDLVIFHSPRGIGSFSLGSYFFAEENVLDMSSSSPPRDRGRSSSARAQRSQSRDAARASLLDLPTTTPVGDLENANEGIDTDNADDLDDATDGNGNDSGTSNDDSGLAKANDGIGSTNVNYGSGVANDNDASASSGLKTPFSGVDGLDIVGTDGSALGSVGTSNTSLRADADVRKMTAAIHAQVEGGLLDSTRAIRYCKYRTYRTYFTYSTYCSLT